MRTGEWSVKAGREWHLAVAVVAGLSVLLQLLLTVTGNTPSGSANPLPTRLLRFVGYFTIQSNVLVCVAAARLALGHDLTSLAWRVVRLAGLVGTTVSGVVYVIALRPISDTEGWSAVADAGLHYATPALALLGWVIAGPRGLIDRRVVLAMLVWPVAWFLWVLLVGALTDYYPYPFIDVSDLGYGQALLNALSITAFLVAVALFALWTDRRLRLAQEARH